MACVKVKMFLLLSAALMISGLGHGCSMRSPMINFSAGKSIVADGEFIASKKIMFTAGEEFKGKGLLEAPDIEITAKTFLFSGTIDCSGTCKIRTEVPFDETMFKRKGSGNFIIERYQQSDTNVQAPVIEKKSLNELDECPDLISERQARALRQEALDDAAFQQKCFWGMVAIAALGVLVYNQYYASPKPLRAAQ